VATSTAVERIFQAQSNRRRLAKTTGLFEFSRTKSAFLCIGRVFSRQRKSGRSPVQPDALVLLHRSRKLSIRFRESSFGDLETNQTDWGCMYLGMGLCLDSSGADSDRFAGLHRPIAGQQHRQVIRTEAFMSEQTIKDSQLNGAPSTQDSVPPAITQRGSPRKGSHSTSVIENFKQVKKALDAITLDGRSSAARQFSSIYKRIVEDLGGEAKLSSHRAALASIVSREILLLNIFDEFLFAKGYLVDKRRRRLTGGTMDRLRLADSVCRHLQMLETMR